MEDQLVYENDSTDLVLPEMPEATYKFSCNDAFVFLDIVWISGVKK